MNNILFFENYSFYYYISHNTFHKSISLCLIPRAKSEEIIPKELKARKKLLYQLYLFLEELFIDQQANFDFHPMFKDEVDAVFELEIRPALWDNKVTSEFLRDHLISLYQRIRA